MLAIKDNSILDGLNPAQIDATVHFDGPYKIAAGAGSGKTKIIISRVAYMIQQGVDPEQILVFTFTKKAANEIKERLFNFIGDVAQLVTMGTYHSFCNRILRRYSDILEYGSNFSIYDDHDATNIVKKVVNNKDIDYKSVKYMISRWKDKMISPATAISKAEDEYEKKIANYYQEYQKALKQNNSMDFDDIIYHTVRLLENNDLIQKQVNKQYQYIISDENQDSSYRDIQLIKLLSGENENIALVGDLNQSIYGFRGANPEAVLAISFTKPIKAINLEQNYRSTQTIVNASEELIKNNTPLETKTSFSKNTIGESIKIYKEEDPVNQASRIVEIIMKQKANGYNYRDMAILYRTSYSFTTVEPKLISNNIPYEINGGIPFYARKEIKDILSYLKFINNPSDLEALDRIINIPKRGIGDKSKEKIFDYIYRMLMTNKNINDILVPVLNKNIIQGKTKEKLNAFLKLLCSLIKIKEELSTSELIHLILDDTKYLEFLKDNCEDDFEIRKENINLLIDLSKEYITLGDFLYSVSLNEVNIDDDQENDKVNAMTIHGSKGLEFSIVIIIDTVEGQLPHYKSIGKRKEEEEERRLFYVAITRAKQKVFIIYPNYRMCYGQTKFHEPSRFIKELGIKNIEFV